MKIITMILIGLSVASTTFADYACKDIYDKKAERLLKNKVPKQIALVGGLVVVGAATGVGIVLGPFIGSPIIAGVLGGSVVGATVSLPALYFLPVGSNILLSYDAQKLISKPSSEITEPNAISLSLEMANKETGYNISYEEWRVHMLNNQDAFCPKGKAITLKQATKNLIERI
jgi:hypothetical protein